ncbi:hypothetical protein [Sphingomonas sp. H160509]|uniref:hypothetical protein n=1 Tax=Sphingomonas sp. H160509 TaxID=2955313 RepID=UPI0031585C47
MRAEIYPAVEGEFLADDNVLVAQGKTFRRAVIPVPASGPARLCLRVPGEGAYALSVVHARSGGHGFSLLHDGIGFAGNPRPRPFQTERGGGAGRRACRHHADDGGDELPKRTVLFRAAEALTSS